MANPPSGPSSPRPDSSGELALMRRLTVFGQELAGTLRRASVVDALLRHIREAFAPSEIAVSLYHRDVDALASVHEWPGGGPDRRALLDLAARRGPLLLADGLDPLVHEGAIGPQPAAGGCWLIVPLIAKVRVTGSVTVRGEPGRYTAGDLALLQGLASQASIALESARLVDLHDDGRRSRRTDRPAVAGLCSTRMGRGSAAGPGAARSGPRGRSAHRGPNLCGYRGAD
ncbi:MAG: GAF domain-containing protein [Gemmatimonadetes bacterium]|nr:GAF domain-containing protein [Gemmatimonadota bacterium]